MNEELDYTELYELGLEDKDINEIKETVKNLKKEHPEASAILPLVVQGRVRFGEKPVFVGYFTEPSFKTFSKYLVASTQNQAGAMRQLARDCYLAGDKELVDSDSLFLFGLMGQLSKIIEMRNGAIVNL